MDGWQAATRAMPHVPVPGIPNAAGCAEGLSKTNPACLPEKGTCEHACMHATALHWHLGRGPERPSSGTVLGRHIAVASLPSNGNA